MITNTSNINDFNGLLSFLQLNRQPLFFRETNPQPRKHTLWQATSDFTGGQASLHRYRPSRIHRRWCIYIFYHLFEYLVIDLCEILLYLFKLLNKKTHCPSMNFRQYIYFCFLRFKKLVPSYFSEKNQYFKRRNYYQVYKCVSDYVA